MSPLGMTLTIDLREAPFRDVTAVTALGKVVLKMRKADTSVEVIGMHRATATWVDRFGIHDKPDGRGTRMEH